MNQLEIRTGNRVLKEGKEYIVFPVDIGDLELVRSLKPIPLTKRILKRCGFKDDDEDGIYKSYRNGKIGIEYYKKDSRQKLVFYESNDDYGVSLPSVNITHLHQLQNICYSLTGEELQIKEA